jgi:hypothetical protein
MAYLSIYINSVLKRSDRIYKLWMRLEDDWGVGLEEEEEEGGGDYLFI